jgi:hypothetical protein
MLETSHLIFAREDVTAQAVVEARAVFVGVSAPNKGPSAVILPVCDGGQEGRKKGSCWGTLEEPRM